MTPSFWTGLPGLITALGSTFVIIGTFLLSQKKSHHEELETLYNEMKKERDDNYRKWQESERRNMKMQKEIEKYENSK